MKQMNRAVNIDAQMNRVGAESEHIYTDDFFEQLTGVANALDNVDARMFSLSSLSSWLAPSPPLDNIRVMVIVWSLRGNIIRTALCWIV